MSINAFAEPIDSKVNSIIIENPSYKGAPFCGQYSEGSALFVCDINGFNSAEVIEIAGGPGVAPSCYYAKGERSFLIKFYENPNNEQLKKIRCIRPRA